MPQLRPSTAKSKYFKKEQSSILKSFKGNFEAFKRLIVRVVLSEQKRKIASDKSFGDLCPFCLWSLKVSMLLLLLSRFSRSDSVRPHRRQPTRLPRPWDSPSKNTGVGCHFLLQCMKVKSESEVAQLCPTLSDPMDCSPPGSSVHGIFQARVLEWGAIAFSKNSSLWIWIWHLLILWISLYQVLIKLISF